MLAKVLYDRFGTAADMQLVIDVVDVCPHRFQSDPKLVGHFLQDQPLHEEVEDLGFTGLEMLRLRRRDLTPVEKLHDLTGNVGRHRGTALLDLLQRIQ